MTPKKGDIIKDNRTNYVYIIEAEAPIEEAVQLKVHWCRLKILHALKRSDITHHITRTNRPNIYGKFVLTDSRTQYSYNPLGPVDAVEPSLLLELQHLVSKGEITKHFETIDR